MKTRPGLVQWIVLAAAGGGAFFGAAHLVAPDAADDTAESLVRDVSAHPSATVTEGMAAPALAPAALPPARAAIDVGSAADTFKARSWLPPPPPPPPAAVAAASAPPPPPSAPPLPFRFVGMLELKSDRPTAFLAQGEALNVVRVGDVIDGTYRIESLSPAKVVVTYLPLKQQQTLSVDGGQP